MGVFDYINFECDCPICGARIKEFQSKDSDCSLDILEPEEVDNWYSLCDRCENYVEFGWKRIIRSGAYMIRPTEEEIRQAMTKGNRGMDILGAAREKFASLTMDRERYIEAFLAETGLHPTEVEFVTVREEDPGGISVLRTFLRKKKGGESAKDKNSRGLAPSGS
jgi:hypothetical protein